MVRSLVVCLGLVGLSSINLFAEELKYKDINEYLNAVVKNNPKAYMEYINTKIKLNELDKEKALYEPILAANVSKSAQNVQTSPEDSYYSFIPNEDYNSRTNNEKLSILGLAPIGTQWELSIENTRLESNVIESKGFDKQYGTYVRASFVQPLLKNFGKDITEIKAESAKIMAQISQVDYEKIITDLVGVSIQAYWQLYGAKQVYKKWEDLVDITEKNLATIRDLVKIGKLPQTEELMLENTLYIRQAELLNAKDKITEAENQILTLLNVQRDNIQDLSIFFEENTMENKDEYEIENIFKKAVDNWDEYKKAQEKLKYSQLQKGYYKNQLLPELNLKGGGDIQRLDSQLEDSYTNFDDKHNTWSIGFEFRIPIFGNEKAKKDYENARLEVLKSRIELDFLTKSLKNSLSTKVEKVNNTRKQVEYYEKGLAIKRELLKFENIKMLKGRVGVGDLLREEEKLIEYEIKMYEKLLDLKVSETVLDKTAGLLLDKYGVNVEEIKHKSQEQEEGQ